jgi:aryl sulfotransferase
MVERAATTEFKTIISSSPRWQALPHRAGDIVVCTPPKVGTTWTQGIVRSLIAGHEEPTGSIPIDAPWVDARFEPIETVVARLEAQTHRRCLKSHTPADGIPLFADAHYIAVYRGGLDSFMSWVNHWNGMRMENMGATIDEAVADGVDLTALPPPSDDIHEMFRQWLEDPPQLAHLDTWWPLRAEPNVTVLHYADLLADLEGEMRRLAERLVIDVPDDAWPRVVARCSIDEMREAHRGHEQLDHHFDGGADRFFHQGTNGRWRTVLTDEETTAYEAMVSARLPDDVRGWFEHGSLTTGRRPEEI